MKKTALILVFLMTQLVSCQTILPLKTLDAPNNSYLKDLDNTFSPYLGTWEGTFNNKKYTFIITKFTKQPSIFLPDYVHYKDELMAKFKVTDLSNGNVIYDNTSAINYDDYMIYGTNPNVTRGICVFYFIDTDANCRNKVQFNLNNVLGHTNQLKYCWFEFDSWNSNNCPSYSNQTAIPMYLPQQDLILTKL